MLKFSIITAVYNNAETISQSICSLNNQIYLKNLIQHIIIDGASTDETFNILKLEAKKDSIILSESDQGLYYALNKGLKLAKGDICGVLHSDDFYADNYVLQDVAKLFEDKNVDIVYGDLDYISKFNKNRVVRHWKSGKFSIHKLALGWMPPHPAFFIRRKIINELGFFDTGLRISADYDAMVRYLISRSEVGKVEYLPRVIVIMRTGGMSNRSFANLALKMNEDLRVIHRHKIGGLLTLFLKNCLKIKQFF